MRLNTKPFIFSLALVFAGVFFAQSSAQAQSQVMRNWSWGQYRVKFKLPSTWNVTDKGARGTFKATGKAVTFWIKPWRDASRTAKDVALAAYRSSTSIKGKRIVNQQYVSGSHGGLKEYMIVAEGWQNQNGRRRKVKIGIIGMINPKSSVNLYSRFFWWADGRYASINNSLTYKVAKSFSAY
ncbi:MAG TPA: hypothetical protein DCS93_42240 [Microscillaceae bacterium]|nr:hypothetical protein [Microscillaceae bacterium]